MSIFESISKVQADIDFIGKDKQVQSGGTYKYRGVDQVLNTLHPLFAKHKVFAVPEVLEIMEREIRKTAKGGEVLYQVLKVKYTFYAEDGTNVSAVVVGEAMDSGDKVSNKCMSVAYKYACFQILSIPTEETCADPDDTNEPLQPNKPAKPDVSPAKPTTKPDNSTGGKSQARQIAELIEGTDVTSEDIKQFILGTFGQEIKVNDLTAEQFKRLKISITKFLEAREEV